MLPLGDKGAYGESRGGRLRAGSFLGRRDRLTCGRLRGLRTEAGSRDAGWLSRLTCGRLRGLRTEAGVRGVGWLSRWICGRLRGLRTEGRSLSLAPAIAAWAGSWQSEPGHGRCEPHDHLRSGTKHPALPSTHGRLKGDPRGDAIPLGGGHRGRRPPSPRPRQGAHPRGRACLIRVRRGELRTEGRSAARLAPATAARAC